MVIVLDVNYPGRDGPVEIVLGEKFLVEIFRVLIVPIYTFNMIQRPRQRAPPLQLRRRWKRVRYRSRPRLVDFAGLRKQVSRRPTMLILVLKEQSRPKCQDAVNRSSKFEIVFIL